MNIPYRQIHLDFHTSPDISDVGVAFDADAFAGTLAKAHVQSVNLFAKCHHGYYYYPTVVGEMHPGLSIDLLGQQADACRRHGIGVVVYTCVGWNERAAELHPEWMQLDIEGRLGNTTPFANHYYKWHSLCVGNKAYRDHLKQELAEEFALFSPDGFWMDIITSCGCVCPSCQKDMVERGMNPQNPDDVCKHDRLNEIGFMEEFTSYLSDIAPGVSVYYNGGPAEPDLADISLLSNNRKCETMDVVDIESLPGGYWGYTHFPICANHLNYRDKPITMMNGRFHLSWGDFGTLRNKEALEYECFRGLACGAHVSVGDQLHPRGTLDPTVYERIGSVFAEIERREPWLVNTTKMAEIGIFLDNGATQMPGLPTEGAYRMFTELHMVFDLLDWECDLEHYDLLVLPDSIILNEQQAERINKHIHAGKAVLVTGMSGENSDGTQLLDLGVLSEGAAEYSPRYLRLDTEFFPRVPSMEYAFYEPARRICPLESTECLAAVVDPYFNRTYDHFCSHRQTPPDKSQGESAVFRQGRAVTISQPLFSEYARYGNRLCKDMLAAVMAKIMPRPLVRADSLPNYVEITLRSQGSDCIIHILNYIQQRKCRDTDTIEEVVPLFDRKLAVRSETAPLSVTRVPQGEPVPFTYEDGYVWIAPDKIEGYEIISIKK